MRADIWCAGKNRKGKDTLTGNCVYIILMDTMVCNYSLLTAYGNFLHCFIVHY